MSNISDNKSKLARIIVRYKVPNAFGCGTGFFINENGTLITCFHVAFGVNNADTVRQHNIFISTDGTEETKFRAFFNGVVASVEACYEDGTCTSLQLIHFNADFDIAIFESMNGSVDKSKVFDTDFDKILEYGDKVEFIGYPTSSGYPPDKSPFAFNSGMVSSFPETKVAGSTYEHVQINAINLGGNSGGPLFLEGSSKVIGIINGNMNWGSDNLAFLDPQNNMKKGSLRVPLGIAYATPLHLLRSKGIL